MIMDHLPRLHWKGLVQGKLDQKTKSMRVTYAIARDVQSHDIALMRKKLKEWYDIVCRYLLLAQYARKNSP